MTEGKRKKILNGFIAFVFLFWLLAMLMLASGCTRTIYIPYGEPVRLRETVKDAKVWVLDEDGEPVKGRIDLHEGWFAGPHTDN